MKHSEILDCLERNPLIAAVHESRWQEALASPAEVLFLLKTSVLSVEACIKAAHQVQKRVFVHIDLADGIGRDKAGIEFLARCGADGIISTRSQLIRYGRELGLLTVQRFFALDSQGLSGIGEMRDMSGADLIEIMPGVVSKAIRRFAGGRIPVIAGGLIETKAEVTEALACGATAVSTGKSDLWYL